MSFGPVGCWAGLLHLAWCVVHATCTAVQCNPSGPCVGHGGRLPLFAKDNESRAPLWGPGVEEGGGGPTNQGRRNGRCVGIARLPCRPKAPEPNRLESKWLGPKGRRVSLVSGGGSLCLRLLFQAGLPLDPAPSQWLVRALLGRLSVAKVLQSQLERALASLLGRRRRPVRAAGAGAHVRGRADRGMIDCLLDYKLRSLIVDLITNLGH